MTDRLYIGTRKGLFVLERVRTRTAKAAGKSAGKGAARSSARSSAKSAAGASWRLLRTAFLGDPVTTVLPDERDGTLYAALNLGHFGVKLHRSEDDGATWHEVAAPSYAANAAQAMGRKITPEGGIEPVPTAPSVSLIWALERGGEAQPGVLWAGTLPGGLFRSADRGESWALNQSLWNLPQRTEWMGGGYDFPGIHTVLLHPRDAQCVTVAVSTGGVWTSLDGGASWEVRTQGLRNEYMPPGQEYHPILQDVHRLVACPARPESMWIQHHNGVFRSTDAGRSWSEITAIRPSKFGFAVAAHPREPDTAWFVPAIKDERRIPVDGKLVVARTRDGGRSFETLSRGLPAPPAYDLIYRHGLAVDGTGDRLAMGSTTGALWSSDDGGDAWQLFSAHLPPIYCVRFAP